VGIWRLGGEDPGLWTVLEPGRWPADPFDAPQLTPLSSSKSVIDYGEGEVLHIAYTPREGNRMNLVPPLDARNRHIEDHGAPGDLRITANERISHHPAHVVADDVDAL
jgi:hypothetical protein